MTSLIFTSVLLTMVTYFFLNLLIDDIEIQIAGDAEERMVMMPL